MSGLFARGLLGPHLKKEGYQWYQFTYSSTEKITAWKLDLETG
jgi:hypothetical protein